MLLKLANASIIMPDPKNIPAGSEPPPNVVTYRNSRRTSPESSITLRHHRLAREASKRHLPTNVPVAPHTTKSPRRKSSGESNETALSDARKWFERTNKNSKGDLDTSGMDIDPPFFQKETDSSNGDRGYQPGPSQSPAYRFVQSRTPGLRPGFTQSSSADDYRSVIDDLTIENKRLKEELKKYKQMGPDSLRRDKLFEVKVHGLPSRKKRELEATLRDFTTNLEGSSTGESPGRRRAYGKSKNVKSSSEGVSKHASSSSGSNSRPVDSAYASMSATGTNSTAPSLPNLTKAMRQGSNSKIENYLRDIPEGLWPRPTAMLEKDRKKLVVRRLEHLFTGKMGGQKEAPRVSVLHAPIAEDVEMDTKPSTSEEKRAVTIAEATREAKIRPLENRPKGSRSRDTGSASNGHSNGDQTDSRDISGSGSGHGGASGNGGNGSGGNNTSSQRQITLEQRPTRPRDLDPDRRQIPSENMDYIRHLGLVAPESQKKYSSRDVSPDTEGWVYLNLLCNLAQLHMLNVTPDFIRSAVSEKSTKFQLSPDGRKIRWRGGDEGTKFSSDSSGRDSRKSQSSDETDGSNDQDQRKKQKTQQPSTSNDVMSQNPSNFKPQNQTRQDSNSSESFHYKPLFLHRNTSSSDEQPSAEDETGSSYVAEESNLGPNSRWGQSGVSGVSQRKRRRDGAIIYYSGAPFCTDLSGDFADVSPDTTYDMTSSGDRVLLDLDIHRPELRRSISGSTLPYRPLSGPSSYGATMDLDNTSEPPKLTSAETDNHDIEANFEWSDSQQHASFINLEASGLGGICPDDHFVVVVSTKRPKSTREYDTSDDDNSVASRRPAISNRTIDSIANRLMTMTTSSPQPRYPRNSGNSRTGMVKIEYVERQVHRLQPVPLPPPAFYYDSSNSDPDDDSSGSSDGLISRLAIPEDDDDHASSSPEDLSGNDEEDEDSDGEAGCYDVGASNAGRRRGGGGGSGSLDNPTGAMHIGRQDHSRPSISALSKRTGSSAATAGGAPSGYNSSMEDV